MNALVRRRDSQPRFSAHRRRHARPSSRFRVSSWRSLWVGRSRPALRARTPGCRVWNLLHRRAGAFVGRRFRAVLEQEKRPSCGLAQFVRERRSHGRHSIGSTRFLTTHRCCVGRAGSTCRSRRTGRGSTQPPSLEVGRLQTSSLRSYGVWLCTASYRRASVLQSRLLRRFLRRGPSVQRRFTTTLSLASTFRKSPREVIRRGFLRRAVVDAAQTRKNTSVRDSW